MLNGYRDDRTVLLRKRRIPVDGPMSDVEICHCTRCQRATGSPFVAEFLLRSDKFRWLRGEELISFYDAPILRDRPRLAAPSAGHAARQFLRCSQVIRLSLYRQD